jgi:hypothetical protein
MQVQDSVKLAASGQRVAKPVEDGLGDLIFVAVAVVESGRVDQDILGPAVDEIVGSNLKGFL